MTNYEKSLVLHKENKGKIAIANKIPLESKEDLSIAYTPGVAQPCIEINKNPVTIFDYTIKSNTVAVVSDGSAVLGLGNIGAHAAIPVMEGKAAIFKKFADIDAFPICLDTQNVDEIVDTIVRIAPVFGGINLEDISSPRCIEIEQALIDRLNIPVFHDDQHGTAIVVVAALLNAVKLVNKDIDKIKIVINGAGSAGLAIAKHLLLFKNSNLIICDSKGILNKDNCKNWAQKEVISKLKEQCIEGKLEDALVDADVFIGVSAKGALKGEWIPKMNQPIIFAMANPEPEIYPDEAIKNGAVIVGTGRSDFDNQINNLLAFPGIFRGALDSRATSITPRMRIAATNAISKLVSDDDLSVNYVIPNALDKRVASAVASAVMNAWNEDNIK